jgi:hypothetical protein
MNAICRTALVSLVSGLTLSFAPSISNAATSITVTSILDELSCSVIPDPMPQGVGGTGGSILANSFRVVGRLTAASIPDLGGHVAKRFDYEYIVNNAFVTRGRPTFSANNASVTSYTGKVIVDAYNFWWKPTYYTAFYSVVDDPISSMQLDDAFVASKIIGGGVVDAVSYGLPWTIVIKGALANGQTRNVAICSLPVSAPMVF